MQAAARGIISQAMQASESQGNAQRYVQLWLFVMAALVFAMVLVGGATRLTESGLSITEWKPLVGAIPPLSDADWQDAFGKYKLIPQYQALNAGMTLTDFKSIYWWEWSHRLLGRLIGFAFFLPFLLFAATGNLPRRTWPQMAAIFLAGAAQGALGWYMVASGLVDRVEVSQYRLAAHLTLATLIFGAILWLAYGLGGAARHAPSHPHERSALTIAGLVLLQICAGGFVAGLRAGMGYNTWPLMDGQLVPRGLLIMEPWWKNLFENALTVQFDHRLIAYVAAVMVAGFAYVVRTRASQLLLLAVLAQIGLGIAALLWQVPLPLALLHQGGALIVFAAALWNLHVILSRSPVQGRR